MIIQLNSKDKDVINSDSFEKIIVDKESSIIKIIGNDENISNQLKRFVILYRNMNNMADDDKTLYKFTVSTDQDNDKYTVIIKGDLKSAVVLMNKIELDKDVKILSDKVANEINKFLTEVTHTEKYGNFFETPCSPKIETKVQHNDKENIENIAEKIAGYLKLVSEDLNDSERAAVIELALQKIAFSSTPRS